MSWFIPPLLVFSFVFIIKQPRFLMPILSPMAMITAWGLGHIKSKKIRLPIVSVVIVFCVMQFSVLSYGSDGMRNISVGTFKIFGKPYYGGRCRIEDLKIDTLIQIIAERSSSNELIQIGSVNVTGARPDNLEIVFWLRMENDFLKPVDLVEMYAWFLKDFDSLDFIVFHTHSASELMWPGGEEFKTLLRRHNPNGIQVIEAIDPLRWNSVLERLENARLDFNLIGTIPKAEAIYYIYERNNRGH
ncbi:MAG: hypothetical protein KKH94_00165 [Candidatus Omnitrophica bacterium]|nr:hypothetical protein [Candidatus Omnitrophota bacterium]